MYISIFIIHRRKNRSTFNLIRCVWDFEANHVDEYSQWLWANVALLSVIVESLQLFQSNLSFPIFFVWADNITLPINLLRLTYSRNERVICIYLMVETKYIKTQITLLLHLSKGQKEIIIKLHICWCASLFCMVYCCLRGIIH